MVSGLQSLVYLRPWKLQHMGMCPFPEAPLGVWAQRAGGLLQRKAVGGQCETALGSLEVQGVPGMCSVRVQHLLLGEVMRSAGLCESGTIRGF